MISSLNYGDIQCPVSRKDYRGIEKKNSVCIIFGYENGLVYLVHALDKKFEDSLDLLLITDDNNSHYVYIKDFNGFMQHKIEHKNRKHFCRYCLQCFSSEIILIEHKKICLKINSNQD